MLYSRGEEIRQTFGVSQDRHKALSLQDDTAISSCLEIRDSLKPKGGTMFTTSLHKAIHSSDQPDVRHAMSVPIVYERVPVEPASWEYHVLTVDAREEDLPDVAQFNELGRQGWLMVGAVDQGATGRSSLIHYYFVRQIAK
jgi:hypothetical protein